jgi:hypothetical protein
LFLEPFDLLGLQDLLSNFPLEDFSLRIVRVIGLEFPAEVESLLELFDSFINEMDVLVSLHLAKFDARLTISEKGLKVFLIQSKRH